MSEIVWYEPKMTSNTTPVPLSVTSSGNLSSAFTAFDGTSSHLVIAKGQWVQLNFGEEKDINRIKILAHPTIDRNVTSFTLSGSVNSIDFDTLLEVNNLTWSTETKEMTFSFENNNKKYKHLRVLFNDSVVSPVWVAEITFGVEILTKRMTLKNPTTNQHYSLADKTLIPLPDASSKNMISFGIETGAEIKLDEDFDKINYPVAGILKSTLKTMVKPLSIKFE